MTFFVSTVRIGNLDSARFFRDDLVVEPCID